MAAARQGTPLSPRSKALSVKIALAHYSSRSDISGVTTWLIGFCRALVEAGHQVVVHLHHFGEDPQQGSILPRLHRLDIETTSINRTGTLEVDIRHTLRFLNQVQPDLFLPQCLHAHFLAAAHAGLQGLPWVFTMHSDDPDYWCVAEATTPEAHGGRSVCVSQFLAQELDQRVPRAAPQVIPCGINIPAGRASFSGQPFRVVYSGRMVYRQKCVDQVVETLIAACTASNRIEAELIGDGPARAGCEQLVSQAGLADRISFLGCVPPEEVSQLLQRSQAILLMSDFEGLPLALLEAMASGVVPVVRSISSGIPELVHHELTGLLVSNNPSAAADALLGLSQNPALWQHCSCNARALAQARYSSAQCFQKWLGLIEQHRGCPRPHYPLSIRNLSQSLPLRDRRFYSQYPHRPSRWSRLHPRRLMSRLRQMARRS